MTTLMEHLQNIRKRPGMYLGSNSVKDLKCFLDGYAFASLNHGIHGDELFDNELSFHDWIALRTHFYESTSGWANMLNERYGESNALDMFFVHYDEYRNRTGVVEKYAVPSVSSKWKNIINNGIESYCYLTPCRVEVVRYTNDPGVFIRFLDSLGRLIDREEYAFNNQAIAISVLSIPIDCWLIGSA